MTPQEASELATHIARKVFESGSDQHCAVTRIQFMAGEWPDNEKSRGGLCEVALVGVIRDALLKD